MKIIIMKKMYIYEHEKQKYWPYRSCKYDCCNCKLVFTRTTIDNSDIRYLLKQYILKIYNQFCGFQICERKKIKKFVYKFKNCNFVVLELLFYRKEVIKIDRGICMSNMIAKYQTCVKDNNFINISKISILLFLNIIYQFPENASF